MKTRRMRASPPIQRIEGRTPRWSRGRWRWPGDAHRLDRWAARAASRTRSHAARQLLDLELDSWLTLATTFAGARLGTLHALCFITPSLRYLAMASRISYEDVHAVGKSDRARNLG